MTKKSASVVVFEPEFIEGLRDIFEEKVIGINLSKFYLNMT